MVAARACAGLVSTAHQLGSEPDNPYLHDNLAVDRAVFELVAALPMELGTLAMRRAAGLLEAPEPVLAVRAPVLPDLGEVAQIDLSTTSPLLDDGAWTDSERVRAAVRSAAGAASPRWGVIAYGQPHVHHSLIDSLEEPATIHLGLDVLLPRGSRVVAPWPGQLTQGEPWVTRLVGEEGWDLLVSGAEPLRAPGSRVAAGEPIAAVTTSRAPALPDHIHVQVVRTGVIAPHPRPRLPGRAVAAPVPRPRRAPRPRASTHGTRLPRAAPPSRVRPGLGAEALLRRPTAHRARLAAPPGGRLGPGVPRRDQQRGGAGPQPPRGR